MGHGHGRRTAARSRKMRVPDLACSEGRDSKDVRGCRQPPSALPVARRFARPGPRPDPGARMCHDRGRRDGARACAAVSSASTRAQPRRRPARRSPSPSRTSSTTWKSRPSSCAERPPQRLALAPRPHLPRPESAAEQRAAKSRPVFSRSTATRSSSSPLTSRNCPADHPERCRGHSWAAPGSESGASRNASATAPRPPAAHSLPEGEVRARGPRRSSSSSSAGRSSWTSENVCMSSTASRRGERATRPPSGRFADCEAEHRAASASRPPRG